MVKHYNIPVPDDDIGDLLEVLDCQIGSVGPEFIEASFQEEVKVDISSQVAKFVETSLSFENKIHNYFTTRAKYLFSEISHDIDTTSSDKDLVQIIEYILEYCKIDRTLKKTVYDLKKSVFSLYGNEQTMKGRGKVNLLKVEICGSEYYLDIKMDVEDLRKFVQAIWGKVTNTNPSKETSGKKVA